MSRRARLKPQSPQLARHRPRRHSPCPPCLRGEYSCETKPIPRLRIADWGLRIGNGPAAGRPLQPAASGLHGPVVQTNPIGRSESCETNPISSGGTRPRRVGHGAIVRNEPNSPRSRVGRSTRGVGRGGKRAKRSQFPAKRPPRSARLYETKPICPRRLERGAGGRGQEAPPRTIVQNEPNSRPRRVGRGSRAWDAGSIVRNKPNSAASGGRNVRNEPNSVVAAVASPHYSSIPSFQHSNPMPIVQNEPNFRR
jgi:hypothetical protein